MYTGHTRVSVDGKLVVSKIPGEPGFKTLSIEDLWSIPLNHACDGVPQGSSIPPEWRYKYKSNNPINLYFDACPSKPMDWGTKLSDGFFKYKRLAATMNKSWYKPKLNGRLDEFRWKLHLKLLRWGVII